MLGDTFLLLIGFVLLIKGADWLVDGASIMARKNKISDLAIGLTIVAFGTSAPELVVNLIASSKGHSEIILGSVIGSNNFNLFAILGVVGLISPLVVQSSTVSREIPLSLIAVVLMYIFCHSVLYGNDSVISRVDGAVLFVMFLLFLWFVYRQMRLEPGLATTSVVQISSLKIGGLIVIGLAGLVFGGKLVVDHAVAIASDLGVSEKTIGLTIIAAGTSLPELVTSIVAVSKKNNDLAVGNIIGSNIFNICLVLAASTFVNPVSYDSVFDVDLYLLAAGTIFLFMAMFTGAKKKLDRWEAAILFMSYIGYTIYLISREG